MIHCANILLQAFDVSSSIDQPGLPFRYLFNTHTHTHLRQSPHSSVFAFPFPLCVLTHHYTHHLPDQTPISDTHTHTHILQRIKQVHQQLRNHQESIGASNHVEMWGKADRKTKTVCARNVCMEHSVLWMCLDFMILCRCKWDPLPCGKVCTAIRMGPQLHHFFWALSTKLLGNVNLGSVFKQTVE